MLGEESDAALVRASQSGSQAAFGEIVARYHQLVCAVPLSATGSEAVSEEVAQETFLAAWLRLDEVRQPGRLRAWLCAIARNLSSKATRRRREVLNADEVARFPDRVSPFEDLAARETEVLVWRALEAIPVTYREPLVLFYRQNRSTREVAEALELSETAVQQRLSRGRRYLQDGLAELVEQALRPKAKPSLAPAIAAAIDATVPGAAAKVTGAKAFSSTLVLGELFMTPSRIALVVAAVLLAVFFTIEGVSRLTTTESESPDADDELVASPPSLSHEPPSPGGTDRGALAPGPRPRDRASGSAAPERTPEPVATATDDSDELKIAALFEGDCRFGVAGHCQEWRSLADRCDRGEAAACVRLGSLLIDESPSQPLWGSVALQRGCRLGVDEVCERGDKWNEWSRFGFLSRPLSPGEEPPTELMAACKDGDQVACGLIEMRRTRDGRHDEKAALAACRAGFRDVCAALMVAAESPTELVRALTAGCDIPDAWLCHALSAAYTADCPSQEPSVCPAPNPRLADRYKRIACALDPSIDPCKG